MSDLVMSAAAPVLLPSSGPALDLALGLTPRERMRLAKLAVISAETSEAEAALQRRRSKREWSLALNWDARRTSTPGAQGRARASVDAGAGAERGAEAEAGPSSLRVRTTEGEAPVRRASEMGTASTTAIQPAKSALKSPSSILRRSSLAPITATSSTSASLSPSSPLRIMTIAADQDEVDHGLLLTTGETPRSEISDPFASRLTVGRRRSSRVRFSEELLPSANSVPTTPNSISGGAGAAGGYFGLGLARGGSADSVAQLALTLPPVSEVERSPTSLTFNGQVSPTFVVKKAKHLPRALSMHEASPSPAVFDLASSAGSSRRHSNSRKSSAASVSSLAGDAKGTSRLEKGLEDMFKAQPLPYNKLDKVLARLSTEVARSAASASGSGSSGSSRSSGGSLSSESGGEDAKSVSSSPVSMSEGGACLRDDVNRSSLSSSALVSPPLSRTSFGVSESSFSASSSFSINSPRLSSPSSLRSSAISTSLGEVGEHLVRGSGSGFSVSTGSSRNLSVLSASSLGSGSVISPYLSNVEEQKVTDAALATNRQLWEDPEGGLSPRSTPIVTGDETVPAPLTVESPASQMSALPVVESDVEGRDGMVRRVADSVDMLPIIGRMSMDSLKSASSAAARHVDTHTHKRSDSTFSIDLSFPLPPSRLAAHVGKVALSPCKKAAVVSTVPLGLAIEVMAEIGVMGDQNEDDGSEADVEAAGRKVSTASSDKRSPLSACSPTTPTPDAVSLTAAVLSVGSPTSERFVVAPIAQPAIRRRSSAAPGDRPPSPDVAEMLAQTVDMLRRRKSSFQPYARYDEDESDIDLAAPLEEAAVRSRILSPNSRLLSSRSPTKSARSASRRSSTISTLSLRSGVGLTSGKGWSGSESEEEEWTSSMRLTSNRERRVRKSVLPVRPAWAKQTDRLSQASQTSTMSSLTADSETSAASTEILTPSGSTDVQLGGPVLLDSPALVQPAEKFPGHGFHTAPVLQRTESSASSSSTSTVPGNFAWGRSSPKRGSPRSGSYTDLAVAMAVRRKSSAASVGSTTMPTPTRDVRGWGKPEVLFGSDTEGEDPWMLSSSSIGRQAGFVDTEDEDPTPRLSFSARFPDTHSAGVKSAPMAMPGDAPAHAYLESLAGFWSRLPQQMAGALPSLPAMPAMPAMPAIPGMTRSGSEESDKSEAGVEKAVPAPARPTSSVPRWKGASGAVAEKMKVDMEEKRRLEEEEEQCAACRFF